MLVLGCFCVLCFILRFSAKVELAVLLLCVRMCSLPGKAVPEMMYTVSGGTLNPTHSPLALCLQYNGVLLVYLVMVIMLDFRCSYCCAYPLLSILIVAVILESVDQRTSSYHYQMCLKFGLYCCDNYGKRCRAISLVFVLFIDYSRQAEILNSLLSFN